MYSLTSNHVHTLPPSPPLPSHPHSPLSEIGERSVFLHGFPSSASSGYGGKWWGWRSGATPSLCQTAGTRGLSAFSHSLSKAAASASLIEVQAEPILSGQRALRVRNGRLILGVPSPFSNWCASFESEEASKIKFIRM